MMRMASRTSSSYSDRAMRPAASTATGNFQPLPRKSFMAFAASADHHGHLAHHDGVGRPRLRDHVAHASGRHRSEEHTSELQSRQSLVCRLLLQIKQLTTLTPKSY